ncbi:T9SS type A sorting domain-containing protein [Flectobacillus roseus]
MKQIYIILFFSVLVHLANGQGNYSSSNFCKGQRISLVSPIQGKTYEWSGPNGYKSTGSQTVTVAEIADSSKHTGIYTVVVDKLQKHHIFVGIYRYLSTKFSISTSSDVSGNKVLSVPWSYASTFEWSGPNNYSALGETVKILLPQSSNSGFYKVTARDQYGCILKDSINLKFEGNDCIGDLSISYQQEGNPVTTILGVYANPYSVIACEGSKSNLSVSTSSFLNDWRVVWYKDGKVFSNYTSISITEEGTYYALLQTPTCEFKSRSITRVNTKVFSVFFPNNTSSDTLLLCNKKGVVQLKGALVNDFNGVNTSWPSFQWYKNDLPIPNANGSTFDVTSEGNYSFKIVSGNCVGTSTKKIIKSADKIRANISYYTGGSIIDSDVVKVCDIKTDWHSLSAKADGAFTVYRNGNQTYSSDMFNILEYGLYVIKATQGNCIAYDSIKIEQGNANDILPLADFTKRLATLPSTCSSPNFNTIHFYNNQYFEDKLKYQLFKDGKLISTESYGTSSDGASFVLKGTNSKCQYQSKPFSQAPIPLNKVIATFSSSQKRYLCRKENIEISLSDCNSFYFMNKIWKRDGIVINAPSPNNPNYGCSLTVNEPGKYWVEFPTNTCTYYSDTITVESAEIKAPSIVETCASQSAKTLAVQSEQGLSYLWLKNGIIQSELNQSKIDVRINDANTYRVLISNPYCAALTPALHTGIRFPQIKSLCEGSLLELNPQATSGNYRWTGPNGFTSTSANPVINNVAKTNAGVYTLTYQSTTGGCDAVFTVMVKVKNTVKVTYPSSMEVCEKGQLAIPLIKTTEQVGINSVVYTGPGISNTLKGVSSPLVIDNFNTNNTGIYKITPIRSDTNTCGFTHEITVSMNKSSDCRSIILRQTRLDAIPAACGLSSIEIPFEKLGNFVPNTIFKVMMDSTVLGEGTNSPIKIQLPESTKEWSIFITNSDQSVSSPIGVIKNRGVNNNSFSPWINYLNGKDIFFTSAGITACDSVQMTFSYYPYFGRWAYNNELTSNDAKTISAKQSGSYQVIYLSSGGCLAKTSPENIVLKKIPKVVVDGSKDIFCGKSTLLAENSNFQYRRNVSYQWVRDGIALSTDTSYSGLFNKAGNYLLKVKMGLCESVSDTIKLKNAQGKVPLKIDQSFSVNTDASFSCNEMGIQLKEQLFQGDSTWKYQWFVDNKLLAGKVGLQLKATESGDYFVRVTKDSCWGVSNTYTYQKPKNYFMFVQQDDGYYPEVSTIHICSGQTADVMGRLLFSDSTNLYNNVKSYSIRLNKNGKLIHKLDYMNFEKTGEWSDASESSVFYVSYHSFSDYRLQLVEGKYNIELELNFKDNTSCTLQSQSLEIISSTEASTQKYIKFDVPYYFFGSGTGEPAINSYKICGNEVRPFRAFYQNEIREFNIYKDEKLVATYSDSKSFENHLVTENGTYQVIIKLQGGCTVKSDPKVFQFNSIETLLSISEDSVLLCKGLNTNISFVNYKTYLYPSKYQWFKDGVTVGANHHTLAVNTPGVYHLQVQFQTATGYTCEGTSKKVLFKNTEILTSITPSDSVTVCGEKGVDLLATSSEGLYYLWQRNQQTINEATQSIYQAKSSGTYRAIVQKGKCIDFTPSVTVSQLPNIPATASISGDQSIDYGKEAKLKVDLGSHAPWTFKLSDGQEFTAQKTPFEITVNPLSTTSYTLSEVKNICGTGTVSGTAKVTVLVLGIEEESGILVEVYPVPTSDYLTWKVRADKSASYDLRLSDTQGRVLEVQHNTTRSQAHEGQLNISTLPTGVYFLQLTVGDKTFSRKVIKE